MTSPPTIPSETLATGVSNPWSMVYLTKKIPARATETPPSHAIQLISEGTHERRSAGRFSPASACGGGFG